MRASPQVRRQLPEVWPLAIAREVVLEIDGYRRQKLDVFDHVPAHWQLQGLPRRLTLQAGQCSRLRYQATPGQRGAACFAGVDLRLFSSLQLWTQLRQPLGGLLHRGDGGADRWHAGLHGGGLRHEGNAGGKRRVAFSR